MTPTTETQATPDAPRLPPPRARRGLYTVAGVAMLALTVTGARGYFAAVVTAREAGQAEAHALYRAVRHEFTTIEGDETTRLETLLARFDNDGIRYIAIVPGPQEPPRASAGQSFAAGRWPRAGEARRIGDRLCYAGPLDGPHAPRAGAPPPDGPPPRFRGRPPLVYIEFEPQRTARMLNEARASLISTLLALIVLAGAVWVARNAMTRFAASDAALQRQRHLADLGQMSAVLAHEIRNPLTAAKGFAQLLDETPDTDRARRDWVREIVDNMTRVENITTALLDFSRTGEIHLAACDPIALLRSAADEVRDPRITLDVTHAPSVAMLDIALMQRVLANLLRNAVQASPPGTPIEAACIANRRSITFTVRDHGPGVPPAQRETIFRAFQTTRLTGTGLGLAVVHRVVELHGGRVSVDDAEGGGALFRITIPLVTNPPVTNPPVTNKPRQKVTRT